MKTIDKNRKTLLAASLCGMLFAAGTVALYQGLVVRRYTVATPKWQQGSALRLALITDLHSQSFGREQMKLLALLKRQMPDIIVMTGDILDERCSDAPAWTLLRETLAIAPVVYAPGNHEYRTGEISAIFCRMEQMGVSVLADTFVQWQTDAGPLLLAGIEDVEKRKQHPEYCPAQAAVRAFASVKTSPAVTVLLAHRPERYRFYRALGFDLALSGHVHGGFIRIPVLMNGLLGTDQGFFPERAGGMYCEGGFTHIVGRGLAEQWLPRVFNPPEVAVIDLVGSGEETE